MWGLHCTALQSRIADEVALASAHEPRKQTNPHGPAQLNVGETSASAYYAQAKRPSEMMSWSGLMKNDNMLPRSAASGSALDSSPFVDIEKSFCGT